MPLGPGTSPRGLQAGQPLSLVKGAIVRSARELAGAGVAHVALPEALIQPFLFLAAWAFPESREETEGCLGCYRGLLGP